MKKFSIFISFLFGFQVMSICQINHQIKTPIAAFQASNFSYGFTTELHEQKYATFDYKVPSMEYNIILKNKYLVGIGYQSLNVDLYQVDLPVPNNTPVNLSYLSYFLKGGLVKNWKSFILEGNIILSHNRNSGIFALCNNYNFEGSYDFYKFKKYNASIEFSINKKLYKGLFINLSNQLTLPQSYTIKGCMDLEKLNLFQSILKLGWKI
jgi:hypothetical protein